jgi:hypothetical protein
MREEGRWRAEDGGPAFAEASDFACASAFAKASADRSPDKSSDRQSSRRIFSSRFVVPGLYSD